MRLFVLRHGDAPYHPGEQERVLSSLGRQQTEDIVKHRTNELASVKHIVSSPVRRARETLSVLLSVTNYQGKLSFDDSLRSESSVDEVVRFMKNHDDEDMLLITHQPLVGYLMDYLADDTGLGYRMGTSCMACFNLLAFSRGCGELLWLDSPC